jgi:signal transduction histidine kinase/ActR/RegA family two-component response regulator
VKLSSLRPSSISLSAQLLLTFVALVAATAVGLTFAAYRSSLQNLEVAAHRDAATVAQTRDQMLTQLLELRQRRAVGFLLGMESLCGEPASDRGFGWSEECVRTMLREFRTAEHASGALLTFRNRQLSAEGDPIVFSMPAPGTWDILVRGASVDYATTVRRGETVLFIEFDSSDVLPLFTDRSGLGAGGEVFLIDGEGRPLTPLRYTAPNVDLSTAAARCRTDPGDIVDVDYRNARVLPAYRPVAALPGACIVAHIERDQALRPASRQRLDLLVRGGTFVLVGILLSLVAARRIAAPVQRLAKSARALQSGDFGQAVPVAGPTEVRELGRAIAAMATDLSELVLREQAARREAEAANRSKDQFLAMLSHELRTPLTAVLGWSHTLRTRQHDSEHVRRAAIAIERGAESLRRLIEDLLDVTGIAAGRVRMMPVPTSVAAVVDAAIDAVGPRADEKGVRIETAFDATELTVYADPQRLQQVVWNLVWNAVKFTPAGGVVHVRTRAMGGLAEVTVEDTGIGIEPEFLPHVFGWFRRADRDAKSAEEGLGLGLALVRQLVELHGGAVRAESPGRGYGSTFVVTLPLHDAEGSLTSATGGAAIAVTDPLAAIRVLVVDDDPGSRETVRVLLEQVGAQVATAASAAEARRHLRAAATDVIISDIAMAQESGYTLMETLRAEGLTLPGIALTGYARREDADKAYAAGFDVYLPKPVDPHVLVRVLTAVVKREIGS